MKRRLSHILAGAAAALLCGLSACHHIDNKRTPPAPVWIAFQTQSIWEKYGVPGALDHKRFIKEQGIPEAGFFTASSQTGYGGVLLVGDILGRPVAYDLSCPVENRPDIRIKVDEQTNDAYCEHCHSRYDIYSNYGTAVSGPADEYGYGLTIYMVGPGPNGEYRVITR